MRESSRSSLRPAASPICLVGGPVGGLILTYLLCQLTPWGRHLSMLSAFGRIGTSEAVRHADLIVLEAISTGGVLLALVLLVVIGGLRGQRELALRSAVAVIGAIVSAELLKHLLPSKNEWSRHWNPIGGGSFPSGHAVIVTSIALAVLAVSSAGWRRLLVGPLLACTAIAATATVTAGWHRPGDVIGSFFLAVAWQRALGLRPPRSTSIGSPTRTLSRFALALPWWLVVSALVIGSAAAGLVWGTMSPGPHAALAYLGSLVLLLIGSLITIAGWPGAGPASRSAEPRIRMPTRSFAGTPRT